MTSRRAGSAVVSLLVALSVLLTSAAPSALAVTARVTVQAADHTVHVGASVSLLGRVSPATKGVSLAVQRYTGRAWATVGHTTSRARGSYAVTVPAGRAAVVWLLRVRAANATSAAVQVRVVKAIFSVRASAASPVVSGKPIVVTGHVTPKAAGSVALQALREATWVTVAKAAMSSSSAFTLRSAQPPGRYTLRVVKVSSAVRAAGVSARLSVSVVPAAPAPPAVTTASLPPAVVGLPYAAALSAAGGVAPYVWSLPGGGLPAGLALSVAGQLTGTPTAVGSSTLTVTVTDAVGHTASRPLVLGVTRSPAAGNTVSAWGYNSDGELGNGTTTHSDIPLPVSGLAGVTAVAGGGAGGYALTFDGSVWAWGYNQYGELGNGTTTDSSVPVKIPGLSGVIAVAGGGYAGYALKSDGTVWAWGYNNHGQLGNGTTLDSAVPVQVSGLTGVVSLGAGLFAAYAARSDGTAWGWGINGDGELGVGLTGNQALPVHITGLPAVAAVAGADEEGYALARDGTVWAWGINDLGQLGDGTTTDRSTPGKVSGLTGVTAVAAGSSSGFALLAGGSEMSWGDNGNYQLGDGTNVDRHAPVAVIGLSGVTSIAASTNEAGYALRFDGTVSAWGYNYRGSLGDATEVARPVPVQVNGLTGVLAIGGGKVAGFGLAVLSG
ncbi:hypothetical protein acdb102_46910 [Acidothermaceae bacterium B102]|nr:hypothetical protein acdb102_46910 [Acidothermaceae bacterium B102]